MRRSTLTLLMLALLTAACDTGGAVGVGSVTDVVPPSKFILVPQGSGAPSLERLRRPGEIAVVSGRSMYATVPKTGHARKLADCPAHGECFIGHPSWSPNGTMVAYDVYTCITHGCGPLDGLWVKQKGQAPRQLTTQCNSAVVPPCTHESWQWSPTGDVLAYARVVSAPCSVSTGSDTSLRCPHRAPQSELSLLDPVNGRLTPLAEGHGAITELSWSPDGAQIAYLDSSGINVISSQGGRPRRIVRSAVGADSIEWSPNGTQIAYDAIRGSGSRIYVMNADGSDRSALVDGTTFSGPGAPAWSPDGSRIAYVTTPGKPNHYGVQFWVVAADGSNRTKIYDSGCCPNPDGFQGPVWSPDGNRIAYRGVAPTWRLALANGKGQSRSIRALTVEGWQQQPSPLSVILQRNAGPQVITPLRYPQNGALTIMGARTYAAGYYSISEIGADGRPHLFARSANRATGCCGWMTGIDWAPDGRHLALAVTTVSAVSIYNGIHVIDTKTGADRQLTICMKPTQYRLCDAYGLDWSPDGTKLAFDANGGVYVIDADGSGRHKLAARVPGPDEGGAGSPSWSPDGTWLVYDSTEDRGIHLVRSDGTDRSLLVRHGSSPAWSPNGRVIAYQARCGIKLVTPTGTDVTPAGQKGCRAIGMPGAPAWSPDGREIAIGTYDRGTYIMNADGSHLVHLRTPTIVRMLGSNEPRPSWQPIR